MEIIKQLRRKKGINQSDLASAIGVSLRTVQLYEKRDANIPIKNLNKIADFFEMSVGQLYLHEVNEGDGSYFKKQPIVKGRSFAYPLDSGKILLKVPLLPTELQHDFLSELGNEDAAKKLFRIDFLLQSLDDEFYMAFEITGDAMNNGTSYSIPNGALVLGKKVDKFKLHSDKRLMKKAFVFVCTDRIICKSITAISKEKATIICHNLNPSPEFRDFEIQMDEIREVYEVIKKQV